MKFGTQMMALGGMILLGGALAPAGNALALGQQWRPALGTVAVPVRPYPGGVANIPSFRPPTIKRASHDRRFAPVQRRQLHAGAPRYRYPYHGMPPVTGPYQASTPRATPAFSGWMQPYPLDGLAHAWRQQVPMFAPQFAWRPIEPRWAVPQAPRYDARPGPRMVGMPASRTGYGLRSGSWRPAAQSVDVGRRALAFQASLSGPSRRTVFRSTGSPVGQGLAASQSGRASMPLTYARAHWRPDSNGQIAAWQAPNSFRPVTYGRSVSAAEERVASRDGARAGTPREGLPGWATTYQDTGYTDACSWCNGS